MNVDEGSEGNTGPIRSAVDHILPPGSPRNGKEAVGFVACTDSILRVFDDRVEIISGVIRRQSVGILYSDLIQILYTLPSGRALGSIQFLCSCESDCDGSMTTVWFKDGAKANKCLRQVRLHAPEVEITQNLESSRVEDNKLKAQLRTKEEGSWGSERELREKALRESEHDADRRKRQQERELRKQISSEQRDNDRRERDIRLAEQAERQRLLQIERPDGFRKDIWEAKKNVFDPNWMRRRLVRSLESKMRDGELVESLASCRYRELESLVIMTNQRLLIAGDARLRSFEMEYAYRDIQSIESRGDFSMTIHVGGHETELFMIGFQGAPMADRLRERVASVKSAPIDVRATGDLSAPENRGTPVDVLDQLARLATLHASGVLTDAEFDAKKAVLLDRL